MAGDFFVDLHSQTDSKIEIPVGTVAGGGNTSTGNAIQMPGRTGLPPLKPPPGRARSFQPPIGPGNASASPPPHPSAPSPPPHPSAPSPPPPPPPPQLKASGGPRAPMPGPPPSPPTTKNAPRPPPPPGGGTAPPRPPPLGFKPPRPSPLGSNSKSTSANVDDGDADGPKTKLKPFFWDKVMANPDSSMVWHQIKSGSFQ